MKDNMLLYAGLGIGVLWLISRSTPNAIAAQQAALQNAADIQSQAIQTRATSQNIQTGANLINNLAQDFAF